MQIGRLLRCLALFSAVVFSVPIYGSPLPIGFLSFDPGTGNTGVFDIVNLTGPNDSTFPDTTFPVATSVRFSNVLLTVDFVGGGMSIGQHDDDRVASYVRRGVEVVDLELGGVWH